MTAFIIFIGLIVGLNCIPYLTKTDFPKAEREILRLLFFSTMLFLTLTILELFGYRLKGFYIFPIIGLTFIILSLIYFVIFKNTKKKVLTIFILTPMLVFSTYTLLFGRVLKEFTINDSTKITVTTGGLLACGEIIKITQSRFGFFDKEIHYESNLCLRGIVKIETVRIDNKHAEFLIYHNGKMDSENPYKYYVGRKNSW